jgi:adenosylhomocysteine nucleosidase
VVRGISDHANGTKETTDREQWQQRAVANAAAFAIALASDLASEQPSETERIATGELGGLSMFETNQNIAAGNARVGVQAGIVHGGIQVTLEPNTPADLAAALVEFRAKLQQAWTVGQLDEGTYAAAEAELAIADEALQAKTPDSKGKLTLALKKVRGLIGDVADLAALVAVMIALAQGLS